MAVPPGFCDLEDSCTIEQSRTTPIPCKHCKNGRTSFIWGCLNACIKCLPGKKNSSASGTK